jgi:hypothetical protein
MLELIEQGSSYCGKLALEYLNKWSLQASMFLELAALNLAKELLLVSYLNA